MTDMPTDRVDDGERAARDAGARAGVARRGAARSCVVWGLVEHRSRRG